MSMTATEKARPEDCATAWFAVLERALDEGDVQRAAQAERELQRLGVDVRFRRKAASR
jgi:hypothetical protein